MEKNSRFFLKKITETSQKLKRQIYQNKLNKSRGSRRKIEIGYGLLKGKLRLAATLPKANVRCQPNRVCVFQSICTQNENGVAFFTKRLLPISTLHFPFSIKASKNLSICKKDFQPNEKITVFWFFDGFLMFQVFNFYFRLSMRRLSCFLSLL